MRELNRIELLAVTGGHKHIATLVSFSFYVGWQIGTGIYNAYTAIRYQAR